MTVVVLFNLLLKTHLIRSGFYIIALTPVLFRLITNLVTTRITEISFDDGHGLILFERKSVFSKKQRRAISYNNCKVETDAGSLKQEALNNFQSFYFLQGKAEICKLDKSKDGFSKESMKNIYNTIIGLGFPITKL